MISAPPTIPGPTQRRPGPGAANPRPVPGRIGGVLKVLAVLIAHARHLAATATARVAVPEFAVAAAVFGTYDAPVILHRVQRGLLRALALRDYLLDRAARGRNLRFVWPPCVTLQPHHRPPAAPTPVPAPRPAPARPRRRDPALRHDDGPAASRLPTAEELAAEVRRRPVGRTITYICLDLGIVPGLCDGAFWNQVDRAMQRYGGSLNPIYVVRARREKTFWRERDRRPETWHIDWRDLRGLARAALGYMIGEPPPDAIGPPVIVPS